MRDDRCRCEETPPLPDLFEGYDFAKREKEKERRERNKECDDVQFGSGISFITRRRRRLQINVFVRGGLFFVLHRKMSLC
ncbi:hypothetical protein B9Z55_009122 [Caenorhabditis nigoni]|nr:hypothetical protein B9Z55_009122 [Caenorhabditis nigoni]